MLSPRTFFMIALLFCVAMSGFAGYLQWVKQLEPCPLCILQRVAVLLIGFVALLAVLHNPRGWGVRLYAVMAGLLALTGGAVSARHVWLQNLPADQIPSCGPGLGFMLDNFPFSKVIELVLRGSGECADVMWSFMGLTIPGWTLLAFCLLTIMMGWQALRKLDRSDI